MGFAAKRYVLLNGVTGAGTYSNWQEVWQLEDLTIHVVNMGSGDTVKVWGSNEINTPSNEVQLGSDITDSDDMVTLQEMPLQIRVELDANGSGNSITVIAVGRVP